jgi:hypothetical protein
MIRAEWKRKRDSDENPRRMKQLRMDMFTKPRASGEEIETGDEITVEETEQEESRYTTDQPDEDHQQTGQAHDLLPHELDLPAHVEIVDWERIFCEQRRIIEEEERLRREKIERAKTLERSWELLRMCKSYLRENRDWKVIKKNKLIEKRKEEERKEQKSKADEKKRDIHEKENQKGVQMKITESLKRLPENERELFMREEGQRKRVELKEVRENLWRKWRGAGEGKILERKKNIDELNEQLRRLEERTENWKKQEEKNRRLREKRERELAEIVEERKKRQMENDKRNEEKRMRKETQKKKEEKWEMIRWLTKFIEENREN